MGSGEGGEPLSEYAGIEERLAWAERTLRSQLNNQRLDVVWLRDACLGLAMVCRRQQAIIEMLAKHVHQIEEQQKGGGDGQR